MFNAEPMTRKSEETRNHILQTALSLFRADGFDAVTMRDIAARSKNALGAAYYYFPSKESLVVAYYQSVQDEHTRRVRDALAAMPRPLNLRRRLGVAMHSKIDIICNDRRLLGAPFRYTGIPEHPLSFLGRGTAHIRHQSIELFRELVGPEDLPKDLKDLLPLALWALHMGLMLYFLYDDSAESKRTRRLIDNSLDLTENFLSVAKTPLLKPFRKRVLGVLRDAELTG